MIKENEYKCGNCGNVYEKGWTDRHFDSPKIRKEAEELFEKSNQK